MTTAKQVGDFFEYHFQLWLQFHSEPLYYTKGPSMNISDKHLRAIARAQHFVRSGITNAMSSKHQEKMENDIFLLDQVHTYCRQQINEPGLPLCPEQKGQGNNGEKDGSANKTATD